MENNINLDPEYVPAYAKKTTDMTVGAWVGTLILMGIPIVNFICLIVWAVSSSPKKQSRKNWAIAQFILMLISLILMIVLAVAFNSVISEMLDSVIMML